MAVDKIKVEEEACTLRFYKIVLSWDYLRLLRESVSIFSLRFYLYMYSFIPIFCFVFSWFFFKNIFIKIQSLYVFVDTHVQYCVFWYFLFFRTRKTIKKLVIWVWKKWSILIKMLMSIFLYSNLSCLKKLRLRLFSKRTRKKVPFFMFFVENNVVFMSSCALG